MENDKHRANIHDPNFNLARVENAKIILLRAEQRALSYHSSVGEPVREYQAAMSAYILAISLTIRPK